MDKAAAGQASSLFLHSSFLIFYGLQTRDLVAAEGGSRWCSFVRLLERRDRAHTDPPTVNWRLL